MKDIHSFSISLRAVIQFGGVEVTNLKSWSVAIE